MSGFETPTEEKINTLIGLLEYIILQRFPGLTPKEVEMMLQLTPIEKTVVGQELIQKGIAQGIQQGDSQGQLKRARKAVNDVLEVRFDIVPRSIIHEIDRIEDVQVLEKLHRKSVNVKDFKEFRSILKKVLA